MGQCSYPVSSSSRLTSVSSTLAPCSNSILQRSSFLSYSQNPISIVEAKQRNANIMHRGHKTYVLRRCPCVISHANMPDCRCVSACDGDVKRRRPKSCPQLKQVSVHFSVGENSFDRERLAVERGLVGWVGGISMGAKKSCRPKRVPCANQSTEWKMPLNRLPGAAPSIHFC